MGLSNENGVLKPGIRPGTFIQVQMLNDFSIATMATTSRSEPSLLGGTHLFVKSIPK